MWEDMGLIRFTVLEKNGVMDSQLLAQSIITFPLHYGESCTRVAFTNALLGTFKVLNFRWLVEDGVS